MNRNGQTLLTLVFIVSAVALTVGLSLKLQSIAETDIIRKEIIAAENFIAAEGCLEEAYRKLKKNPSTYRSDTLLISESSCTIAITGTEPALEVAIYASRDSLIKKLKTSITITKTEIQQLGWFEIP